MRIMIRSEAYMQKGEITGAKNKRRSAWAIASMSVLTLILCSMPDTHSEKTLGMEYTLWFDMLQHGGYYFYCYRIRNMQSIIISFDTRFCCI